MRITIGEVVFASKQSAARAARSVLYRYQPGETVRGEDAWFLAELLARHPERETKIGVGVLSFQIQQNLGSRGFWLTRIDGTCTDWSFLSCLSAPTHAQEVKAALRTEVRDQIYNSKAIRFSEGIVVCPITGDQLSAADAHADHDPPFEELVSLFVESIQQPISAISVQPGRDGDTDTRLQDRYLAVQWCAFHQENARLRLVSQRANLSLLRRRGAK